MAGVKGRSGTNKGHGKSWADAIRMEVSEVDLKTGKSKLRYLAEKIVKLALSGDVSCMKEIGDRLDGRAAQSLTLRTDPLEDINHDELPTLISLLRAAIDDRVVPEQAESSELPPHSTPLN